MSDTSIKIQNIYYLFLYAWDKFNEGNLVKTGTEQSPDVPNLFECFYKFSKTIN